MRLGHITRHADLQNQPIVVFQRRAEYKSELDETCHAINAYVRQDSKHDSLDCRILASERPHTRNDTRSRVAGSDIMFVNTLVPNDTLERSFGCSVFNCSAIKVHLKHQGCIDKHLCSGSS